MLFSSASIVTVMRPSVPTRRRKIAPRRGSPDSSRSAVATRYGAHAEVVRTLRHQQADRTVPLQLERERAAELEGRGEEHRGGHRLTEQLAHHRRVIRMRAQLAPRALEAHPVAAHRLLLEYEATHLVAHRDSVRIHSQHNGAATHATQPRCGAARWRARRRRDRSPQPPSFRRSSSFSCAGLALPAVAFMTWPTKNPNSLSLPARYSASRAGLRAITSSITRSMAAVSVIWRKPCASITASALAPPDHMVSNTSLAILPEMVWSQMRRSSPARRAGGSLPEPTSRFSLFRAAASSPMTQFAASFGSCGSSRTTSS